MPRATRVRRLCRVTPMASSCGIVRRPSELRARSAMAPSFGVWAMAGTLTTGYDRVGPLARCQRGRNRGTNHSPLASKVTSTGMPMRTSSMAQSTMLVVSRTVGSSSSSTMAIT